MSSPLSMLKKTRRVPLEDQGDRLKVPFRRNLVKEGQSVSADPNSPGPSRALTSQVKSKVSLNKAAVPSDFELMSAMMQRVTMLERKVQTQAQDLEHKDKKIFALEEKLRLQRESESKPALSSRDNLESRCQQLQNQVHEMESFLNDYGLIWVGDSGASSDSEEGEPLPNAERDPWWPGTSVRSFTMNFDLVLQRIRDLNVLAGEGESVVQSTATGAKLCRKDPVQLRLYSNGIVMFDGPFRSYQDRSTQQCMQDLMNGYFPSELQQRFPGGVPLEVHDRREEEFISRLPWSTFPGEGRSADGGRDPSAYVGTSQIPGKKLTTDQFLNRLPKVVVKAGRVIDVRDSLRATLQGSREAQSSDAVTVIDTAAQRATRESCSPRDAITLKVKSEDGNHAYVLKMRLSETIGCLRQYLDKQRGGGQLDYDIISTCPRCSYNDSRTLQSCGLTTKTVLLLKRRKPAHSLAEDKNDFQSHCTYNM